MRWAWGCGGNFSKDEPESRAHNRCQEKKKNPTQIPRWDRQPRGQRDGSRDGHGRRTPENGA